MPDPQTLRIGQLFRYSKQLGADIPVADNLPNFTSATRAESGGQRLVLLERGINPIAEVVRTRSEAPRRPAILIRSSPHRIGSDETPWQDLFDPDNGRVVYFGDNKRPGRRAEEADGNRVMLSALSLYSSRHANERAMAPPLLFFEGVPYAGRTKGQVAFRGFGLIRRAALITQYHARRQEAFANYKFECVVFGMAEEGEEFGWRWINARRDPNRTDAEVAALAPSTWKRWVREGESALPSCQRRVARLHVLEKHAQQPRTGTREGRALLAIYDFYASRKHRFEALAAAVVHHILDPDGTSYLPGWITARGGDGGTDFVGRLDVGSASGLVKIVVLGQAKCERMDVPTSGRDIARTVARLRRGWIGAYVTTSFFSARTQEEIIEDQYPILLVHGRRLASEVLALAHRAGFGDVEAYLWKIDETYDSAIKLRRPEEILTE